MSLKINSDKEYSKLLKLKIQSFNRRIVIQFIFAFLLIFIEVYIFGILIKKSFLVYIFVVPTAGVFLYKLLSGYSKAIECPKCGQPYNLSKKWFSAVPFSSKCQNCGLIIE